MESQPNDNNHISPLKARSFTRDITLSLTILITVVIGSLFAMEYIIRSKSMSTDLELNADNYISELTSILVVPVWTFDDNSVAQICKVFYQNELVYSIHIEDIHGQVLCDLAEKQDNSKKISRTKDIIFEQALIGKAQITLTSRPFQNELNRLVLTIAVTFGAVFLVLIMATGMFLRVFIKQPLNELKHGMDRVAEGKFDHSFANPTHKELGEIADRFSNMVREVHQREEILAEEVAERKRAEERYALAVRGANDGIWDWDLITNEIYYSPRWKAIIGFRDNEFPNDIEAWKKRIHVDNRQFVVDTHMNYMAGLVDELNLEYRLEHKNGSFCWVHTRGASLQDEFGESVRISGAITDITRRKQDQLILRKQEELYLAMVESFDGYVYICDQNYNVLFSNGKFKKDTGRDPVGEKCHLALHGYDTPCPWCKNELIFAGETIRAEIQSPKDNRWYYIVNAPIYNPDGTMTKQIMMQDITERKLAENELKNSETKYRTLIETTSEGYVMLDTEGAITAVNHSFCEMLGYREKELKGMPLTKFMDAGNSDLFLSQMAKWATVKHRNYEFSFIRADGSEVNVIASSTSLYSERGEVEGAFALFMDITERKRMENQLRFQAMHDPLTGLANRTLCHDRIGQALERARRRKEYFYAVIFIDLDRFKAINDTLGHVIGDQLLREVSLRISECTRELDTVARVGGDEFVVLLEEMNSPRKAIQVIKRMRENLRKPISLAGTEVQVTISMGIVLGPGEYESAEEILRYANIAMHRAKAKGRDRFKVFSTKLLDRAVQLMTLETDMDNALAYSEFFLHYQPIICIKGSQRLCGFEALVRWQHPTRGVVPPNDFIPVAEESGLITDLGLWVLYESCRTMTKWRDKYPDADDLFLSVNVSARQFSQQDLTGKIKRILNMTGMPPERLKLEITETAIMENAAQAVVVLKRLKKMGITLSIDDFGTGYSSMSYLQKLPIDNLKIDISFVQMLDVAPENIEIVKAIISLAHTLELDVVAEGVEKKEHQNILLALGCKYYQGFLYSRPLHRDKAEALISNINSLTVKQ